MISYSYFSVSEQQCLIPSAPKGVYVSQLIHYARAYSEYQGPVVQSVVTCSLTSSLRVISLTVLADSIHNILIFFAEKM